MNIGKAVHHYTKKHGISLSGLAQLTDYSYSLVNLLINNKREMKISHLERFAKAMNLKVSDFIFLAESEEE